MYTAKRATCESPKLKMNETFRIRNRYRPGLDGHKGAITKHRPDADFIHGYATRLDEQARIRLLRDGQKRDRTNPVLDFRDEIIAGKAE